MERKIYKELLNWKETNIQIPLMVIRGKTSWKNIYNKKILWARIWKVCIYKFIRKWRTYRNF